MNKFVLPGLTLVFTTLKLLGVITWYWFFVLSPMIFWVALALSLGFFIYHGVTNEQIDEINKKMLVDTSTNKARTKLRLLLDQATANYKKEENL